ncbi:MAG: glycosyltransferase [Planctomycetes bacterium]|nr:glycosyltransferase [Planctomycetota bacterium]
MIDPRQPDFDNTPASPKRAGFGYSMLGGPRDPAVSIITPFYNTGPVFHETALSVFAQSLQNFEWVIVNDGSTNPESLAMLAEYRGRDPRIRVIDLPINIGPGGGRNAGIRAARAPLVFQLDADDLIEPTLLEKAAWFLASHPRCDFVQAWTVGFAYKSHLWKCGFHDGPRMLRENVATIMAMIRRDAFLDVGGFDESIVGGMEDWDLWIRMASKGRWGGTIPEHLAWYRRRPNHADVWQDWDGGERQRAFAARLRERYPDLTADTFPTCVPATPAPYENVRESLPLENPLAKHGRRLLLIVPWLTMGGADKFNLRAIEQLKARGWEITVVTTLPGDSVWMAQFTALTPDVFVTPNFLRPADRPAFIRYLIETRSPDVVLTTNSELGYLILPYLRSVCPGPAYADYCHMEEEYWKNGGYPRYAAACQEQLDLNIVSSNHLKSWMTSRGGDPARIEVCNTNEDCEEWKPDADQRASVRRQLNLDPDIAVILYAGRICDQKQPRVFAQTMLALRARGRKFVALVAGDGVDRPWLQEFVSRNDLDDCVKFLGAVPNARMRALMAASDIFFLPSLWEGISLAIFEAMAAGLAIVGADVGGQKELVTPECGVLIPRSTPEAEAAAYTDALAPIVADPSLARRIGEIGRRRIADHFQLKHMGERLDSLLQRAIELRDTQPRPAIPPGLGHELAVRAVEYQRLHSVADQLWSERERLRQTVGAASPSPAPAVSGASHAEVELAGIQRSRFFNLVQSAKRNPIYRVIARWRWGPQWELADPNEPAEQKLARLKSSRSYKFIQAVKATGAYRVYALRRYGTLPAHEDDGFNHTNGVSVNPANKRPAKT